LQAVGVKDWKQGKKAAKLNSYLLGPTFEAKWFILIFGLQKECRAANDFFVVVSHYSSLGQNT